MCFLPWKNWVEIDVHHVSKLKGSNLQDITLTDLSGLQIIAIGEILS